MRVLVAAVFIAVAGPSVADDIVPPKAIILKPDQSDDLPPGSVSASPPVSEPAGVDGQWVELGGDCRYPDLTVSGGGSGVAKRSSSQSEDGSSSSTYSYSYTTSSGGTSGAGKSKVFDPETGKMIEVTHSYSLKDGQLVDGSGGTGKVYQRCDGSAPARKWKME